MPPLSHAATFELTDGTTTVTHADTDGTTDMYVAKVSTLGVPEAVYSIASGSASGGSRFGLVSDVIHGAGSDLFATGYWKNGNLTFQNGDILQNPRSGSNSFVAKVSHVDGSVAWSTHITNTLETKMNGVESSVYSGVEVVVTIGYKKVADATASSGQRSDGAIYAWNGASGAALWEHIIPGLSSCNAVRMNDAGIYVACSLLAGGTATIGGAAAAVTAGAGDSKIAVFKIGSDGVPAWSATYGGSASAFDLYLSPDGTKFAVCGGASGAWTSGSVSTTGAGGILAYASTTDGAVDWAIDTPYLRGTKISPDGSTVYFMTGAVMSTTTLGSGANALEIRVRGSSDVIVGSVAAATGVGNWAVDFGGTGMEYPWGFDIDGSGNLFMAGLTMSSTITFGSMSQTKPAGAGMSAAYLIKLSASTQNLPSCVSACSGTPTVNAGYCYIGSSCYAADTASPFSGHACFACKPATSQTAWSGPNTTSHCFIAGGCKTEGQSMPAPPPPGGGYGYGRRLAELDDATVNDLEEHEMIAMAEKDSEMEYFAKYGEANRRQLYGPSPPPTPTCKSCRVANWTTGWSVTIGDDYIAATDTCNGPINTFSTPTLPEMATSTKVNAVKSALGAMTGSDFSAVNTAYAAARRRQLQTAPATSLKGKAEASYAGCARWAAYNALYTDGSSPFYSAFTNFLDGFIQGAIDGTGSFAGLSTADGRMEAVEKGVADQLATMMMLCALAGPAKDTTAGWDSAYSYYYGDTPSRAPYGRGNKRCANYGTCMEDGVTAKTNQAILAALTAGRAGAAAADSTITAAQYAIVESQLMIIYYQASLRYMFKMDLDVAAGGSAATRGNDHQGEGWAFWRVIEPYVVAKTTVGSDDYNEAYRVTQTYNTANEFSGVCGDTSVSGGYPCYCRTKNLLEANLPAGTTTTDMGTLIAATSAGVTCGTYTAAAATPVYVGGVAMYPPPPSPPPLSSPSTSSGLGTGALVAIIVGAIVAVLAIGIGIYMMKKGPKTAPGTKGVA